MIPSRSASYTLTMLEVKECSHSYAARPGRRVFESLSFSAARGETVAVLGPSGCGKSTLLHLIAGITRGSGPGSVTLDGTAIPPGDLRIGFIPQHYGLLPWFTVLRNIEVALTLRNVPERERREKAVQVLARVGLRDHLERYPGSLSGGEQQRVALARALAAGPELLLLDEPFSSLDAITREHLQDELRELSGGNLITVLVTHSIEEAAFLAGATLVMGPGPGSRAVFLRHGRPEGEGGAFRRSPAYFERCRTLRAALEEACL